MMSISSGNFGIHDISPVVIAAETQCALCMLQVDLNVTTILTSLVRFLSNLFVPNVDLGLHTEIISYLIPNSFREKHCYLQDFCSKKII